ncbi:unnamed protein product [Nyctereutes procyonoides]|uniref:(raccoon dog) hypothetical protein n=1 Tax=Nyctereutes procyonoides TaxID=34880 RepID=A0A811XY02_NYCPR|nr:unnamed protein product [Nyctereutes procyonoides]
MSETAVSRTPNPTPFGRPEAAQSQAQLPSEASLSVVTSWEQQPVISLAPKSPRVPWQSPEEPSLQPQIPGNAHPNRKDLFFQGQPTTLGALQILIGFLLVSSGGILAAALNFMEFPTTYWYLLVGGVLMKVSTGLHLVSLLCASLGICAFMVELTASSRYTHVPQKSLLLLLLFSSVLELGITPLATFLGWLQQLISLS